MEIFGTELGTTMRFAVALIIVLALIAVTFFVLRRFGGVQTGGTGGGRGRQPRLAVLDQAAIDSRRKLLLIRRDNVEHLLMIGGPNDVVVETSIVRAPYAAREPSPEIATRSVRAELRELPPEPAPAPAAQPDPPVRHPTVTERPALAPAIALGAAVTPQVAVAVPQAEPSPPPLPRLPDPLPVVEPQPAPIVPPVVREPPRVDNLDEFERMLSEPLKPVAPPPVPPAPPISAPEPVVVAPKSDPALDEITLRLEEALKAPAVVAAPPVVSPAAPPPIPAPVAPAPVSAPPVIKDSKPAVAKSVFDNLEDEMANLLGRSRT